MALIECSECGKNISTKASICPHCGAPNEQGFARPTKPAGCFLQVISGIFIIPGAGFAFGGLLYKPQYFIVGIPLLMFGLAILYWGRQSR